MPSSIDHSLCFAEGIYSSPSQGFSYIVQQVMIKREADRERWAAYKFTVPWRSSHIHSAFHCHVTSGGELSWTSS